MARELRLTLIDRAKIGAGVDYTLKTIMIEPDDITSTDVAVVQLNGVTYYRSLINPKNKKVARGLPEYHIYKDDETYDIDYEYLDLLDYATTVLNIKTNIERRFSKAVYFFDEELRDVDRIIDKSHYYEPLDREIFKNFLEFKSSCVEDISLSTFAIGYGESGWCHNDKYHFEEPVHIGWASKLIEYLK